MGEGGFEPPKSLTTDLQSAPFGHSGIPPYSLAAMIPRSRDTIQRSDCGAKRKKAGADTQLFAPARSEVQRASFDDGAGRRTRTGDLLITKSRKVLKMSFSRHF